MYSHDHREFICVAALLFPKDPVSWFLLALILFPHPLPQGSMSLQRMGYDTEVSLFRVELSVVSSSLQLRPQLWVNTIYCK